MNFREDDEAVEPSPPAFVASLLNRFVNLVLWWRTANGTWTEQSDLKSFHVYLSDVDDNDWVVRINDESFGWKCPRAARSMSEGDDLKPEDLLVERISELPDDGERYIHGRHRGDQWFVTARLNVPHPSRPVHFDAGVEFFAVATSALEQGYLRAFHANAFHAIEHLAKAELLTYAMALPEIVESRKHSHLRSLYQMWANLENTDRQYARLLDDLTATRGAITYADDGTLPDVDTARAQHAVLKAMLEWVKRLMDGGGPKIIRMIATDAIDEGQLVGTHDLTVRRSGSRQPRSTNH